jgi:hypothetical protein
LSRVAAAAVIGEPHPFTVDHNPKSRPEIQHRARSARK